MKKFFLLILTLSTFSCSPKLSENKIIYIFPSDVEKEIIKLISNEVEINTLIIGQSDNQNYIHIIVGNSNRDLKNIGLYKNIIRSNRVVQIDTELYPLLFQYDIEFTNKLKSKKMLSLQERMELTDEGNYWSTNFSHEGYTLIFNKKGKIVSKNWNL